MRELHRIYITSELRTNMWIRIEDRLPESRKMYLVHLESGGIWAAYYRYWGDENRELWQLPHYDCDIFNWEDEKITHWMPLPEFP